MWFSLFATVLILAITFYQGLQGMFSALINCILTILAAALAFGLYEDVYTAQLAAYQPDHGRAIALMAIFIVSLLVLRLIMDQIITGNMSFPVYLDRAGGGLFGLVTAMIIIGTLAVGFQLLPFDSTFLGFSRYTLMEGNKPVLDEIKPGYGSKQETDPNAAYRNVMDWNNGRVSPRHSLWLNPDGFTVALVSHLSDNALQGRNRFADFNPDFLDYLHAMRDGMMRESIAGVGAQAVRIKGYHYLQPNEPLYRFEKVDNPSGGPLTQPVPTDRKPAPGKKWLAVSVIIDEKSDTAQDKQNLNFTPWQVRLLGRERKDGSEKAFPLIAVSDPESPHLLVQVVPAQDLQFKKGAGGPPLELLFEVPDSSGFQPPWVLQYKYNGLAEILASHADKKPDKGEPGRKPKPTKPEPTDGQPKPSDGTGQPPEPDKGTTPPPAPAPGDTSTVPPRPNPNPPGRVHGVNLADKEPFFSDDLPFVLTSYNEGMDLELKGGKLLGVKDLTATLNADWEPEKGSKPRIEVFEVPEGQRLLQVSVAQLHPESWIGSVMGTAVSQIQNIYLIDSNGKTYMPIGKYAIANVNGETVFELTYLDETARGEARIPPFDRIRRDNLKDKYAYVFLFHVRPGTKPAYFNTGQRKIPLDSFNLVAPK
jgi:hypothetical protein